MRPAESAKYHSEILEMNPALQPKDVANSRINPTKRTITYWHEQWRLLHLGPRNGQGMLEKLKEKITIYTKVNVTVAFKENPFAVAVLTPIMKRAHSLKTCGEVSEKEMDSFVAEASNHLGINLYKLLAK
ncbi:unnamed protein product [Larinioides sclopetarius]|uniref:Uncharacterized protein n=1 Tax=Larinioides sclopetarius TaxID=280406 RepID=A0AAV2BZJ3_9ARAC